MSLGIHCQCSWSCKRIKQPTLNKRGGLRFNLSRTWDRALQLSHSFWHLSQHFIHLKKSIGYGWNAVLWVTFPICIIYDFHFFGLPTEWLVIYIITKLLAFHHKVDIVYRCSHYNLTACVIDYNAVYEIDEKEFSWFSCSNFRSNIDTEEPLTVFQNVYWQRRVPAYSDIQVIQGPHTWEQGVPGCGIKTISHH